MLGVWTGEYTDSGKKVYKFTRRTDPEFDPPFSVVVPCGRCLGCRLDYSRSWADRMMLELETEKKAIFCTLTYDNDHVPILSDDQGEVLGFTLDKRDCQLFMKRLRRRYDGKDGHSFAKIRFYLSGEYGSQTLRPHYHAIIFGLSLDDFPDRILKGVNELKQPFFCSDSFSELWPNGFILLSDVSYNTCAYVSRYVLKKAYSDYSEASERGVSPEFNLMSRNPGIGSRYLELHPDCLDLTSISLSTDRTGKKIMIPKYFLRKCSLSDPDRYDRMCLERKSLARRSEALKLSSTTLSYLDMLELEENSKLSSCRVLDRRLE